MGDRNTDRAKRFLLVAAALLAAMATRGTAQAHPEESHQADAASESLEAGEANEGSIAESRNLRFADRRHVLFRLGFGGKYEDALVGRSTASPTFGATLRWDRPVHEYVATGIGLSFYSTKPSDDRYYEPAFDIDLNLRGRYPFEMGREDRRFESEVYVLVQFGLTIWIDSNSIDFDLIGPGWNVGVAPGYQVFINERVGLLAELGWIRTQAFFSRGKFALLLNQAVFRVGAVFPF